MKVLRQLPTIFGRFFAGMMRGVGPPAVATVLLLSMWEVGFRITEGLGFASPAQVFTALAELSATGRLWGSLSETVLASVAGLGLGLLIALAVGFAVASSSFLWRSSMASVNFLRVIPSVALIPLFLVSLGNSLLMTLSLTAAVSSFKLFVFVSRGVRDAPAGLRDTTTVLRLGPLRRGLFVFLPSAAASVMLGLRLTVARAYGVVVLVGLTTSGQGLGGELIRSKNAANTPEVFAYALIAGLVGMAFFYGFSRLDRVLVFWRQES